MVQIPIDTIHQYYPSVQAVYLFGSAADGTERADSDIDIALLLPPEEAKGAGSLAFSDLRFDLEAQLGRRIDLVNLRTASTVFKKEITCFGVRVFTAPGNEADIFEMLVLSFYGKLNEERAEILEAFASTGRAYKV
jgi:predicted nucleotidyltransferase